MADRMLQLTRPYTTGDDVRWLQARLRIPVDGVFGPQTDRAVRDYQAKHGLVADGVVGPKTWATLHRKPAPGDVVKPPAKSRLFGLDWAWGRPSLTSMRSMDVKFAMRYLSWQGNSKNITKPEAHWLRKGGLAIGLVFETNSGRAWQGKSAGRTDAVEGRREARAIGFPDELPIYYAADRDAAGRPSAVGPYFDGLIEVASTKAVGVYGSDEVVRYLMTRTPSRRVRFGWQTYAWSRGAWYSGAQIQQYSNSHVVGGVGVDYNRTTAKDAGLWLPPH